MSHYWLKRSPAAPAEGPYTGSQLKQMAAEGQIAPTALLSADNVQWAAAAKVKGLFPESVAATNAATREAASPLDVPAPPPPMPSETAGDVYDVKEELAPAYPNVTAAPLPMQPLAYASSVGPQPRNLQWYLICAIALAAIGIASQVLNFVGPFQAAAVAPRSGAAPAAAAPAMMGFAFAFMGLACVALVGVIALYVYYTVWAYKVHQEFAFFSNGAYPITPGKACGFCYIPFFSLFWNCYMPFKLAKAVEWHLGAGRAPRLLSPTAVLTFQIIGVVSGCVAGGLPILFIALSMRQIQNGLNDLWANPAQVPAAAGGFPVG